MLSNFSPQCVHISVNENLISRFYPLESFYFKANLVIKFHIYCYGFNSPCPRVSFILFRFRAPLFISRLREFSFRSLLSPHIGVGSMFNFSLIEDERESAKQYF